MQKLFVLLFVVWFGCWDQESTARHSSEQRTADQSETPKEQLGEETAREILRNALKAHGGEANISKLRVAQVRYALVIQLPSGENDVIIEETYQLPKQMRKVVKGKQDGKSFEVTWAVDGDIYWFRDSNDETTVLNERRDIENGYRPFLVLEQLIVFQRKDVQVTLLGEKKEQDRMLVGVNVKPPQNVATQVYFDKKTGLLAATAHRRALPDAPKEVLQEVVFSNYKESGGVKLFQEHKSFHDGKKTAVLRIQSVKTADKFDASVFAPPKNSKGSE